MRFATAGGWDVDWDMAGTMIHPYAYAYGHANLHAHALRGKMMWTWGRGRVTPDSESEGCVGWRDRQEMVGGWTRRDETGAKR